MKRGLAFIILASSVMLVTACSNRRAPGLNPSSRLDIARAALQRKAKTQSQDVSSVSGGLTGGSTSAKSLAEALVSVSVSFDASRNELRADIGFADADSMDPRTGQPTL